MPADSHAGSNSNCERLSLRYECVADEYSKYESERALDTPLLNIIPGTHLMPVEKT